MKADIYSSLIFTSGGSSVIEEVTLAYSVPDNTRLTVGFPSDDITITVGELRRWLSERTGQPIEEGVQA